MAKRTYIQRLRAIAPLATAATVAALALAPAAGVAEEPHAVSGMTTQLALQGGMQPVTLDQLQIAILAPEDLGPDFLLADESVEGDPLYLSRFLVRTQLATEQVLVGLGVDPETEPASFAERAVRSLGDGGTLPGLVAGDRQAAEWLSPDAAVYDFTAIYAGMPLRGSVYAWRQGAVLASLIAYTRLPIDGPTTPGTRYAERQRDKLSATLAATPADLPPPQKTP